MDHILHAARHFQLNGLAAGVILLGVVHTAMVRIEHLRPSKRMMTRKTSQHIPNQGFRGHEGNRNRSRPVKR